MDQEAAHPAGTSRPGSLDQMMFWLLRVLWVGTVGMGPQQRGHFAQSGATGQQSGPKVGTPVPEVGKPLTWQCVMVGGGPQAATRWTPPAQCPVCEVAEWEHLALHLREPFRN